MGDDSKLDITGTVSFADAAGVAAAPQSISGPRYGDSWDRAYVGRAFADLSRAFRGDATGILAADTPYHDLRHSFDTALTMARLVEGHERAAAQAGSRALGARLAMLGVVLALFHDVGFLRRTGESGGSGAVHCHDHEERSVDFVREYLREGPLADLAPESLLLMATKLDWKPGPPDAEGKATVASLLGTADLLCQIADRNYLERCRAHLFDEFVIAGIAGRPDSPYPDRDTLLRKTIDFLRGLALPRLERELHDCQRFLPVFFGGEDPYHRGTARNLDRLERMIASGSFAAICEAPAPLYSA